MNPLVVVPIFAYTIAATLWPGQVDGSRRGRTLLLAELLIVAAALVAGNYLGKLVEPRTAGLWWGRAGLLAAAYLYACEIGRAHV